MLPDKIQIKKYSLQYYVTNDKLKKLYINKYITKMERNDKLNKIDISNRTCYYFDDLIEIENFDLDHVLIDKKSYEYIYFI